MELRICIVFKLIKPFKIEASRIFHRRGRFRYSRGYVFNGYPLLRGLFGGILQLIEPFKIEGGRVVNNDG